MTTLTYEIIATYHVPDGNASEAAGDIEVGISQMLSALGGALGDQDSIIQVSAATIEHESDPGPVPSTRTGDDLFEDEDGINMRV